MNGTNWAAVALVSFPGSGNTWVRGLLQQATGVCTGRCICSVTWTSYVGIISEGLAGLCGMCLKLRVSIAKVCRCVITVSK